MNFTITEIYFFIGGFSLPILSYYKCSSGIVETFWGYKLYKNDYFEVAIFMKCVAVSKLCFLSVPIELKTYENLSISIGFK